MGLWKKLDRLAQGSVFEDLTRGISSRMSACSSSQRDKTQDVSFTIAVIVLGAKLAKADGKVTREEVSAFKEVFDIPENEKKNVARLFDSAKTKSDGFAPYAKQIGKKLADIWWSVLWTNSSLKITEILVYSALVLVLQCTSNSIRVS